MVERAFLMLLLFKPWRSLAYDLLPSEVSDEAIIAHFQEWRNNLQALASTATQRARPLFDCEAYWACCTIEKMCNLDMVLMRCSENVPHDFLLPQPKDPDEFASDAGSDSEGNLPSEPSDVDAHIEAQNNQQTARMQTEQSASANETAAYLPLTHRIGYANANEVVASNFSQQSLQPTDTAESNSFIFFADVAWRVFPPLPGWPFDPLPRTQVLPAHGLDVIALLQANVCAPPDGDERPQLDPSETFNEIM